MSCAVCGRQARGFGWSDPRLPVEQRFLVGHRQVFCSMRCQAAYSKVMDKTEGAVVDATEMEQAAMRACLMPLGEYVGSIGMQRTLADYTREEVMVLIEVVVTAYQAHMLAEHERLAARERAYCEKRLAGASKVSGGAPGF